MARHANIMSFDDAKRERRPRRHAASSASSTAQSRSRNPLKKNRNQAPSKGRLPLSADIPPRTHRLSEEFDAFPQKPVTPAPAQEAAPMPSQPSASGRVRTSGRIRVSGEDAEAAEAKPVSAIQSYDEFLEEEADKDAAAAPKTAKEKREAAREQRKRAARKEEAERKFQKTYGKQGATSGEGGPRAAIYKGEMGRKHKHASKMQQAVSESRAALQSFEIKRPKSFSTKKIVACAIAACIVFACAFLYEPARIYYKEMREVARLELEYQAVLERNETIAFDVGLLQTERGIQDKAREMLGWIPADEKAASVVGAEFTTNSNFSAHVVSEAIKPPATWYSPILDPLFGVS